jgi:hypothetical protein
MVLVATGGGCGCRVLVAPAPQGSDRLTERPLSLVAIGCWFALHGFIFEVVAVEFPHGSFDAAAAAAAELLPGRSIDHGSSTRKKSQIEYFLVYIPIWRELIK